MADIANTQVTLPLELAERLERDAAAKGLDLPAYLRYLVDDGRTGPPDAKAQDAARFLLSKQHASLKKLAE
jgi:hypothetical protein